MTNSLAMFEVYLHYLLLTHVFAIDFCLGRQMKMEAKLKVIIDDNAEKLVLPLGIPDTMDELQTAIKNTYGITEDFSLQFLDSDFRDFFTLHRTSQIKDKDTIKIVYCAPVVINLFPLDESACSVSSQSTDLDSASFLGSLVEDSPSTSDSQDTIPTFIPQNSNERCLPWPRQFPIPELAYEVEVCLQRGMEEYNKNGARLNSTKIRSHILEKLAEAIFKYTAYPTGAHFADVAEALIQKYPCLKEAGSYSGFYGWQQSIKNKMSNYRTKLRHFDIPEVTCNSFKHKLEGDKKSAKNVKKNKKGRGKLPPTIPP